jgi:hypothetical protein
MSNNHHIPDGTTVRMGGKELVFGEHIVNLPDASSMLDDVETMRQQLVDEAFLFIRGLHDPKLVHGARLEILKEVERQGGIAPGTSLDDAVIAENNGYLPDGTRIGIQDEVVRRMPSLLGLTNGERMLGFFDGLLGRRANTYTHKWIRIYQRGHATDIHYDAPYMGRDAPEMVITAWTPLGDISLDMGPITLVPGSNRLDHLKAAYGKEDAIRGESTGYLTNDPFDVVNTHGLKFATTIFEPGDMLLFTKYILHGSLENTTNRYRLSTDTRYQHADEKHDEHYTFEKRSA